ncbi:MAG: Bacterial regulatory protein luxR family [Candidatus Eremiobacteraeota bacterium]|nr:Bacterial regulatory protein luxR family [Candidatus Eremiobacteraeota bacterium]
MLTGAAFVRGKEIERGFRILATLQAEAASADSALRSEIALHCAFAYFCRRELDEADRALGSVATDSDIHYARALEYRGWIACARAKYALATDYFKLALDRLDLCRQHDRYLEANCIQVLGALALERLDTASWEVVRARRTAVDWSSKEIQRPRFWVTLAAATFALEVEGSELLAVTEARDAEAIAPTPAARVEALCRRASTMRTAEQRLSQCDHTAAAYDLFKTLDPKRFDDSDKLVPLVLAMELCLAGRVEDARGVFLLYRSFPFDSPLLAMTGDPTRYANEKLIEGVLAEASDNRTAAHRSYLESFVTFRRIGYERRAVHAALRLGWLRNESAMFEYAAEATRHLPERSWLRQQSARVPTDIVLRGLQPAQRDVLKLLCAGRMIDEIAQERGVTSGHVKNTVSDIYKAFRVRNRAELLSELLRRGVLKPA